MITKDWKGCCEYMKAALVAGVINVGAYGHSEGEELGASITVETGPGEQHLDAMRYARIGGNPGPSWIGEGSVCLDLAFCPWCGADLRVDGKPAEGLANLQHEAELLAEYARALDEWIKKTGGKDRAS